jgi:hypothetical protein
VFIDATNPAQREEWLRYRSEEFSALMRRVDEVIPAHSLTSPSGLPYLAVMWERILSPLLRWEESGFTERHWSELTDAELRRFVLAGIERECVLCNRSDDFSRAQTVIESRQPVAPMDNDEARRVEIHDPVADTRHADQQLWEGLDETVQAMLASEACASGSVDSPFSDESSARTATPAKDLPFYNVTPD